MSLMLVRELRQGNANNTKKVTLPCLLCHLYFNLCCNTSLKVKIKVTLVNQDNLNFCLMSKDTLTFVRVRQGILKIGLPSQDNLKCVQVSYYNLKFDLVSKDDPRKSWSLAF